MELLATRLGWAAGGLWLQDADGALLRCAGSWSDEAADATGFSRQYEELAFPLGAGLPGRVWSSGEPAWVPDDAEEAPSAPGGPAAAAGLRAAVAIPVLGPEGPVGALELLGREPRVLAPAELEQVLTLGRQIGQYVTRVQAEEQLRHSQEVSASIVRAALDCIVTMDHEGRVVDFNPAAEATFGYRREDAVGQVLAELIIPPELRDAHHSALRRLVETGEPSILGQRLELTAMRADGRTIPVELVITRLGTGEPPVFTGFLRDITERRRAEDEVTRLLKLERDARLRAERAERSTRSIAFALQRSLLPPHMPEVPRVELGAAYRPAMQGALVGGDFYDVFELGVDRWGIAIGDVRGKGADAAAVTALMRYTIRTAAVREPSASAVLQLLNDALLRNPEGGDYCTAIYASLDVGFGAPSLQLAVGGHPLPLLSTTDGWVRAVGKPGTLLGAVPDPVLADVELTLGPGDLLLLFTDGVTEARTPDGMFGVERLCRLLGELGDRDASAVARGVESAVVDGPGHRVADDVALLAVRALP
ncbi:MAG TPA: SpoIIE family protein phosphatase [Solirubrobacteraceae bacterium]